MNCFLSNVLNSLLVSFVFAGRTTKPTKNLTMEDEYIKYFKNDPHEFWSWDKIREMYQRDRRDNDVKKYCAIVHKKAGYGKVKVPIFILRPRFLSFENEEYETRHVDVLAYGVEGEVDSTKNENYWYMHIEEEKFWYIQQGRKPTCVYCLTFWNRTLREFRLNKYVCGVPKLV